VWGSEVLLGRPWRERLAETASDSPAAGRAAGSPASPTLDTLLASGRRRHPSEKPGARPGGALPLFAARCRARGTPQSMALGSDSAALAAVERAALLGLEQARRPPPAARRPPPALSRPAARRRSTSRNGAIKVVVKTLRSPQQ